MSRDYSNPWDDPVPFDLTSFPVTVDEHGNITLAVTILAHEQDETGNRALTTVRVNVTGIAASMASALLDAYLEAEDLKAEHDG